MQESSSSPAYLWQVPGKPVSVRLDVDLIERLAAVVQEDVRQEGLNSVPWRALEVGGLLLGRSRTSHGQVLVEVDDFDPIESEHAAGPSLMLSDPDREGLEARLAGRRGKLQVVGFYRSHTRRSLGIEVEDVSLFSTYFAKASNVFLLIKPRASGPPTAGFLMWEGGKIRSAMPYLEFPLSGEALEKQGAVSRVAPAAPVRRAGSMPALLPSADGPVRREASARSAEGAVGGAVLLPVPVARFARQSVPAAPRNAGTPPRRLRVAVRTRWGWEWAAAAAVIAGVLASAILSHPTTPPAPASAAQTSVAARSDPGLALKVAREGDSLRVAWDRAAQGIANAQRAVLWIRDGDGQDKIDLDPDRLRAGSIAYRPKNGDVTFRMEVYTASASSGELVRSAGALYASPAAPSVPAPGMSGEADRAELAELAETAAPFTPVPLARHAARRPRRGSAQRVAEPRASTYGRLADARPAMSLLPEPPKIDAPPAAAPDVPLGGEYADPFCRVTVVPASHSRLARVFGKLRGRSGVALPSPVRDPAPAVPLDVRQRISGEVEIDVRVLVGPTGAVRDAELLSKGKDAALADLALFASRRSEFTSPREAGLDVPAELVLRYRFGSRNQ